MLYFNHFSCKEFFPNCSMHEIEECVNQGFFDNLLNLFMVLDTFRDCIGQPIRVTSTYRDEFHNERVGGVKTSQHKVGSAIDFKCDNIPFENLVFRLKDFLTKSAMSNFLGQVIFYHKRKFIHIGLRTPGHPKLSYINYEQGDN